MDIQTIDVQAKKWFDKVNGNSYFSAQVTINFGTDTEKTIYVPFQYGYGNAYLYESFRQLQMAAVLSNDITIISPTEFSRTHNYILRHSLQEGCKKSEVKQWGSN